jgi:hypothetical protein
VSGPDLSVPDFCWLPDGRIVCSRQESPGSDDDNLWQIDIDGQTGHAQQHTETPHPVGRIPHYVLARPRGWKAAGFRKDDISAAGSTVQGKPVPSVTQVLHSVGLAADDSTVPPDVLEPKRIIGQYVHNAAQYLDEGCLDLEKFPEESYSTARSWRFPQGLACGT